MNASYPNPNENPRYSAAYPTHFRIGHLARSRRSGMVGEIIRVGWHNDGHWLVTVRLGDFPWCFQDSELEYIGAVWEWDALSAYTDADHARALNRLNADLAKTGGVA